MDGNVQAVSGAIHPTKWAAITAGRKAKIKQIQEQLNVWPVTATIRREWIALLGLHQENTNDRRREGRDYGSCRSKVFR
jgi:hypothetical protein